MTISLTGRIVRFEEALALAVHADDAGDEIGLAGLNVTVSLVADDLAAFLQAAQGPLQGLCWPGGKPRRRSNWGTLAGA